MGTPWRIVVTAFSLFSHVRFVFAEKGDSVKNHVDYLWSVPLWTVPIARNDSSDGILEPSKLATLAQVALKGFRYYTQKIVPKQLEQDATFAQQYNAADDSRLNRGFVIWQKQMFARKFRVSYQHLNWDGAPPKKYDGVPSNWKQFFDSAEYASLQKAIAHVARHYLSDIRDDSRKQMTVMIWAEVYPYTTMQLAHTHTGALCGGMIAAKITGGADDAQTIVIEDPRTAVDPFGRQHEITPVVGDLYMWPGWTPHMVTPQTHSDANVYLSFLVYDKNQPDLDWEDDPIGDYVFSRTSSIRSQQPRLASKTEL